MKLKMNLKYKRWIAGGLAIGTCLFGIPTNHLVQAENTVNNKVDTIITLKENIIYSYDLDGDGDNDKFYYDVVDPKDPTEYAATLNLYIDDKLYLTRKDGGFTYEMQLCDLNTSDSFLDLYLSDRGDSDTIRYSSFARFDGTTVSEITGIKENPAHKDFNFYRFALSSVKGDGTFKIITDTPIFSDTIGCYFCYLPYQEKDGELTYIPVKTFSLAKESKNYKYVAKKAFTVYKAAGSKTVAFQIKKGATLHFDKLYISKYGNAYVRAVNKSGKTGWIRGDLKNLFYQLPLWG